MTSSHSRPVDERASTTAAREGFTIVGIGFPALELVGFDPQQPDAGGTLALFYGAVPIAFKFAATALVWNFPLDRAGYDAVRQRMDRTNPAAT